MIDWSKRNVCDSCDVISSKKSGKYIYIYSYSNEKVVHPL